MLLQWHNHVSEQWRQQWNALVMRMEMPEVFFTWEWAVAVERALGGEFRPWIGIACEGMELVGVAPLGKTRDGEVVFLAGNTADYCDFVSQPERREEFVARVLDELREQGTRSVVLANLPSESRTVPRLKRNRAYHSFVRLGYECPQVRLGSQEQRQELLEALRQKKMLRRSLSELSEKGPLVVRGDSVVPSTEELESFFRMHVARFLGAGRVSNLVRTERRKFLAALCRLFSEAGCVELMALMVADRAIAYNYGFKFAAKRFWYQPTFDNDWEEFSPGFCLLAKMIEDSSTDSDLRVVDLGLGAEGYKERFANAQRTTLHVTMSKHGSIVAKARARYWAANLAGKYPKVESIARAIRSSLRRFRSRLQREGLMSLVNRAGVRFSRWFLRRDEIAFYRWSGAEGDPCTDGDLCPLNWDLLARAAMKYSDDEETLEYLMRCASRLRSHRHRGHVLVGPDRCPQHFLWTSSYTGFAVEELQTTLPSGSSHGAMIFDCWTPRRLRGHGLYRIAIESTAKHLSKAGEEVWIFASKKNRSSVAGIQKTAFERRFTMVRSRALFWSGVRKIECCPIEDPIKPSETQSTEVVA